jgi:hypothetical protein
MLWAGLWPKVIMFHRWPKRLSEAYDKRVMQLGRGFGVKSWPDLAQENTDLYCNGCSLHKLNHCKKRFYQFGHLNCYFSKCHESYESESSYHQ